MEILWRRGSDNGGWSRGETTGGSFHLRAQTYREEETLNKENREDKKYLKKKHLD